MPNIAQILKNEILRLSRREVKAATEHLTDTLKELKHQNAFLKKEIAGLREQIAVLADSSLPDAKAAVSLPRETRKRLGASGIRKMRIRLGLSRQEMALLLDVNPNSIFLWEQGNTKPRAATRNRIIELRSKTKRKIAVLLAEKTAVSGHISQSRKKQEAEKTAVSGHIPQSRKKQEAAPAE